MENIGLKTIVTGGVAGLVSVSLLWGSWYTVDQTERGVLLRNGAFVEVVDPGLHFKMPWLESVAMVGTTQRTVQWSNTTTGDFRQQAYSQDQQPASLSLSVIWHIPVGAVEGVYGSYRNAENTQANLIERRVPQAIKTVFGQFTAVSAIQERAKLNAQVFAAVTKDPEIANGPVVIDGVQVEDIEFSKAYIESVEGAMQARVAVQKLEQQQQQQEVAAKITVIDAQAQADARIAAASAEAKSTKLRGDAEASAIRAKGDALRDNPRLVDLIVAERWNGALPQTMTPGGAVPFLNLSTVK